jgi:hypothetical protein
MSIKQYIFFYIAQTSLIGYDIFDLKFPNKPLDFLSGPGVILKQGGLLRFFLTKGLC